MNLTPDLFGSPPPVVSGFRYGVDLVSEAEASSLLERFRDLAFKPFDFRGFKGNRQTVAFGSRYDFTGGRVQDAPPIPDWLRPLKAQAAAWADVGDAELEQALVAEYQPGAGIGWHRDRPEYDRVVGISFASSCTLRLRRRSGERWVRATAPLEARSVYLLTGEVRELWQHSISPGDLLRYSVTFRTMR